MSKLKIVTVVGARPQFVKAAALSPSFARHPTIEEMIIHTGQHFDPSMSDIFFEEMSIPAPSANLGIGGGTHGQNTGKMIQSIESILLSERPDCVVVFGDTDSTLAAAIAASKLGIMLVHIEAGLRSFRRAMPEEINRVLTDHVADVLYAPSSAAEANLHREGIDAEKIMNVGDVMFDVVKRFSSVAAMQSNALTSMKLREGEYHFMTLHRKENTDDPTILQRILDGLSVSDLPIVFPIHPRTAKRIADFSLTLPTCVRPVDPLGYIDTIKLVSNAACVLTDSGGLQKEAYFLRRPCITLRDETEWVELVTSGANALVGADSEQLASRLKGWTSWKLPPAGIYGDGHSAERIASDIFKRISI